MITFKSPRELRKFGAVMTVALGLLGALFLWRKGLTPVTYGLLGAAAFFLVFGLILPQVLGPIEWAWMKIAAAMGWVMTRVILTLTWFLAITPIGLLMRLTGRDSLGLKPNPQATTHWSPTEKDGPGTRPYTPY